jgi:predicted DNA-binding antitoxin AbrB/MazE fold protein
MAFEVSAMTIAVDAVYEGNGVLKLEQPVALREHEKVRVVIETQAQATPRAEDDPTGWKAIDRLMGIGKAITPDVSDRHDDYLYGDPRD